MQKYDQRVQFPADPSLQPRVPAAREARERDRRGRHRRRLHRHRPHRGASAPRRARARPARLDARSAAAERAAQLGVAQAYAQPRRAARRRPRRGRPRHLAEPSPPPAGQADPRRRPPRRVREAAGDDRGRVGASWSTWPASSGLVNAVNFNIRFYPLNQHLHELVADGRARRRPAGQRPLLPGLAAAGHRLELASRAGPRRRAASGRRHRLALARPVASSPACGSPR